MEFTPGDKVRHPGKPEWGAGTVLTARKATHEGAPCQRLEIRFDGAGRKTISTAFAALALVDAKGGAAADSRTERPTAGPGARRPSTAAQAGPSGPAFSPAPAPSPAAAPATLTESEFVQRLVEVPDRLVDPFRPLPDRLADTLSEYAGHESAAGLLGWASAKGGVSDPLSIVSRHDLERAAQTFRVHLDRHLKALLEEARRTRIDAEPLIARAPAPGQHAVRRVNPGR